MLSLALVLGLLLALLPQPAMATTEFTVITVKQAGAIARLNQVDGTRSLGVYVNGVDDLLISGEDLADSTGFTYENDGKYATFTRGTKSVRVELADGDMFPVLGGYELMRYESISDPIRSGDQWYFSAGSLLPWLNVTCYEEDGCLVIYPDEYSFWDIWGELDLAEYEVSYGDLIREYEWDSKVVKAMNFTQDNVAERFTESLKYTDEYDGSVEDYFDILECLLLDSTHSEYLADTIHDAAEGGLNVADLFAGDFGPIVKAFQVVNDGIYYASQYCAFTANHSDKMELLNSITLNSYGDTYTSQLVDATIMLKNTYSSWWQGILNKFVLNLDKYLVDLIKDAAVSNPIGKAILLAVDVATKEIQNLNERISLMAPLYNLYSVGRDVYESTGNHYTSIRARRCHAIISLYAAGENFRTLSTYSDKHDLDKLADKYERLAGQCDDWIRTLTAASTSQMNDSFCYWKADGDYDGDKLDYTNLLLDEFAGLDFFTPPSGGLELVEYAMLADFLEYQPLIDQSWDIYASQGSDIKSFVFDGTLEQGGTTLSFQWELDAATRGSALYGMSTLQRMKDPDLSQVTLSGAANDIFARMDSYFDRRGGLFAGETTDLNGDGAEDRLYAILGSANLWLDCTQLLSHSFNDQNPLGRDSQVTLVAAESVSGGVRVRVMRLMLEKEPEWTLEGGTLTIDGTEYVYRPEGEDPFYGEPPVVLPQPADVLLTDLLLATPGEIGGVLADYSDFTASDGTAIYGEGWLGDAFMEVTFEEMDGLFRCTSLEVVFGEDLIRVTPELDSTAGAKEAEAILQPTLSWDLTDSESVAEGAIYYHSNFYYDFPADTAWYATTRILEPWEVREDGSEGWGESVFAGVRFMYSDSLNEDVPDWLLNSYGDHGGGGSDF